MGRMLQTLKQAETQRLSSPPATTPPSAVTLEDTPAPETGNELEIPFIEWGPSKSMEASPSVLAAPAARAIRSSIQDKAAVSLVAPPHSVLFRAVTPGRTTAKFAPELVAFHEPDSAVSTQYRELFRVLLAGRTVEEAHALLFTATPASSGTTTVLLNTAITAARSGRRHIAVVDANLSQAAVAGALGLAEKPGLREVLAGTASLDEALQETAQADLTVLTAGLTQPNGGIRYLAATVRSLLRQLRQRFDLIFVAAPPWDGRPETVNLATICDAVYLVLSPTEAETPEVDELIRRIPEQGAKLAGCILVAS